MSAERLADSNAESGGRLLGKREAFRATFAGFHVERLLAMPAWCRHRGKIKSTINNVKRARETADEFGSLAAYVWRFEPDPRDRLA